MSTQNPIYIKINKTSETTHKMESGEIDQYTGKIIYEIVDSIEVANHLDQQLQFAVGIEVEDIIQNGAATPYINILLEKFDNIKIELR